MKSGFSWPSGFRECTNARKDPEIFFFNSKKSPCLASTIIITLKCPAHAFSVKFRIFNK